MLDRNRIILIRSKIQNLLQEQDSGRILAEAMIGEERRSQELKAILNGQDITQFVDYSVC